MLKSLKEVKLWIDHYHKYPQRMTIQEHQLSPPLQHIDSAMSLGRFHVAGTDRNIKIPDEPRVIVEAEKVEDGTHDDMNKWVSQTEWEYSLGHPIESHADFEDEDYIVDKILRSQGEIPTHPKLSAAYLDSIKSLGGKDVVNTYVSAGLRNGLSSGSRHINDHLVASKEQGIQFDDPIVHRNGEKFNVKEMDNLIKSNPLPHDLIVYAGLSYDPNTKASKFGLFTVHGYFSCTTKRATAARYAMGDLFKRSDFHIIECRVPRGTGAIYLGHNGELSDYKDDEVILGRNTDFKIIKETIYKSEYKGKQRTFHIWQVSIVPNKDNLTTKKN